MKKLFLFASVAALVAACGKNDDNNPTPPDQGGQGGGQQTQQTTPTPVPAGFVKTIKEYDREESESSLLRTTTYKVENNLLKGWEVLQATNYKVTSTLEYEGPNLKTFKVQTGENDSNIYIYTFSYQNNKLDKIIRKRGDDENIVDTYQITLDDQGRIIKKKHVGADGWDGQEWEATFTYTGNTLTVQKRDERVKYIYTYTGKNATKVVQEPSLGVPTNFEYDTEAVNDLNNKYIYLTYIAQLFNPRHGIGSYDNILNSVESPFVLNSENVVKKDAFNDYEIQKNAQNKPTKIIQKQAGIALKIKVYGY